MRVLLASLMAVCFVGQAAAAIEVAAIGRGVEARIDSILTDAPGTFDYSQPLSAFITDGVSEGSAEFSAVGITGTSLTFNNSLSTTGTVYAQASISMLFFVTDPTSLTIDFLTGQSGRVNLITADSDYIWTPTDDASITIALQPMMYLLEAYWVVTTPDDVDSSLVFSSADGITVAPVPEASSVAAWSLLALMGLALPLAGRLRRPHLRP